MKVNASNDVILALYPNRFGFGYAVLNSPKELVEYGQGYVKPFSKGKCMKRMREFLDYYEPNVVIVRSEREVHLRSDRLRELISMILRETSKGGRDVHQYTRKDIKEAFNSFKANSKFQISQKLIEWFPRLKHYSFPDRKRWMSEHQNAGIFDAVALAITHYYLVD